MNGKFVCSKMRWEFLFAKENNFISGDWNERNGFSNWHVLTGENYEDHIQMMSEAEHHPFLSEAKETERKMKEMLTVEDVSLLRTVEKKGITTYFFGFRITSPVAKNDYFLCDTWEDTLKQLTIPEPEHYFLLEAIKSENGECLFEPTTDSYVAKMNHSKRGQKPRVYPSTLKGKRSTGIETHSTFKEDLTKSVTEHPSVRLEMLYV